LQVYLQKTLDKKKEHKESRPDKVDGSYFFNLDLS